MLDDIFFINSFDKWGIIHAFFIISSSVFINQLKNNLRFTAHFGNIVKDVFILSKVPGIALICF